MNGPIAVFPSYEDWIEHVFGHAVRPYGNAWYFDTDATHVDAPPLEILGFMTRLLAAPEPALEYFADDQIAQGLYYVISPGASDYMHHLYDIRVPVRARAQCFGAMFTIFERIFAPRCAPVLSHLDEPGSVRLNGVCYMWWDILATGVGPHDPGKAEIDAAILSTLGRTLALPSIACQEAALHGLGHSMRDDTSKATALIDAFLREMPMRPELARYAQAARSGCVQ